MTNKQSVSGHEKRERSMRASYYAFTETGVDAVDDILEQVAIAGKMYHHTDGWGDRDEHDDNKSYVDRIQESAEKAASEMKALHRQISLLRGALEAVMRLSGDYILEHSAIAEKVRAALQTPEVTDEP